MSTTTTPPTTPPGKQLTKADTQRMTLRRLFEQQKPELDKLMPRGMAADRLFRMALTECIKNPDLLDCTAESWALAIQTCAQQGLYPDSGLGYMYLVPRKMKKKREGQPDAWVKEVSAMRGYQGDIKLARNTGEVEKIYAEVVYAKDEYKVTKGLDPNIVHVPCEDDDPGALRACYAVAKLVSGEVVFVTLTRRDVERHRASSQGADSEYSPWKKHEAAMWKKTGIHELFKWLPKSGEKMEDLGRDIATEGKPIETTAIDLGTATIPAPEERPALEAITDRLESEHPAPEGAPASEQMSAPEPRDCPHPTIPPSRVSGLAAGQALVCPDCGTEIGNPDAVQVAPADAGSADAKKKSGQGRLLA